jgi:hypothetical protein
MHPWSIPKLTEIQATLYISVALTPWCASNDSFISQAGHSHLQIHDAILFGGQTVFRVTLDHVPSGCKSHLSAIMLLCSPATAGLRARNWVDPQLRGRVTSCPPLFAASMAAQVRTAECRNYALEIIAVSRACEGQIQMIDCNKILEIAWFPLFTSSGL